jgi:type IV pilus assembly protein PilA
MFNLKNKIRGNEAGFTLVELLVVILIIGVLAAIAVPIFLNQRQSANEAALRSDIHSLQGDMENCAIKSSPYPDIWVNWGGTTIIPACVTGIKLSNSSSTHAFDFGTYYPASGVKAGDAYCIEANNIAAGLSLYFRSDKGTVSTTRCQNQ